MKQIIAILISTLTFTAWANMTGTIGATSNYIWRGITQTNNASAIQGSFDFSLAKSNWGVWMSNTTTGSEADFYLGHTFSITKNISLNGTVTYYHYLPSTEANTTEISLGIGIYAFNFTTSYTNNYFNSDSSAFYFTLNHSLELCATGHMFLNFKIGYSLFDKEDKVGLKNYFDYSIDLEKQINNLAVKLTFSDTDLKAQNDENFIITGTYSF